MRATLISILAALTLITGCAPAPKMTQGPKLSVEGPWVRTTQGAKDPAMTGAFLTVANPGEAEVRLVSAECGDAGMVQLHEMVMVDGKMAMAETKNGIVVPAGGHAHLTPGGYHIMLMKLKRELPIGDQLQLALNFSDGTRLQVTAPVKEFVEEEDHYHSPTPTPSQT